MYKSCRIVAVFFAVLSALALLFLIIFNLINNVKFFEASLSSCLSLLVAIIISFYFSQRLTDSRRQKEFLVRVIESLQCLVRDKTSFIISEDVIQEDLTTKTREISNRITTLEKYQKNFKMEDEVKFVREKFTEYEELIGNHIRDLSYLRQSSRELRRPLELIDQKLFDIMLKLYQ